MRSAVVPCLLTSVMMMPHGGDSELYSSVARLIVMADNLYWEGKVHKPMKFGDSFDPRTVEGRWKAARRAA